MKKEQVESNIYVWPQAQIASNLIKAINRSALPKEMEAFYTHDRGGRKIFIKSGLLR